MKAQDYKEIKNAGDFDIVIVKTEDDQLLAYCTDERWNGEYYRGWKCDEHGNEIAEETWNIKPIYQGVGEQDQDGDYENYTMVGYDVWQS